MKNILKLAKIKLGIPLLLVAGLLLLLFFMQNKYVANPINIPFDSSQIESRAFPAYSMEDLKNRQFSKGVINVERQVAQEPAFTSFIISYDSEGLKQYALMNIPNGDQEKYPVAIVNHGYIDPKVYSTTESYKSISASYTRSGFLVLKPDYRGHANSQGEETVTNRLAYPVDVINLLYSLESIPKADTSKIFMYGHSMGGDVTLKVLEVTDMVTAASLWAPVAQDFPESWFYFIRNNRSNELDDIRVKVNEIYATEDFATLSPLNYLDRINADIIIHHGTADESVPYSWGEELNEKLQSTGKNSTLHTYPGADHNMLPFYGQAVQRDLEFFKTKL